MPCPIVSSLWFAMQTLKMNAGTAKHSRANKMIVTCHVRHIFMPTNQTVKK